MDYLEALAPRGATSQRSAALGHRVSSIHQALKGNAVKYFFCREYVGFHASWLVPTRLYAGWTGVWELHGNAFRCFVPARLYAGGTRV